MLNYQSPIAEGYMQTTMDVKEFSDWEYEKIETYLD